MSLEIADKQKEVGGLWNITSGVTISVAHVNEKAGVVFAAVNDAGTLISV